MITTSENMHVKKMHKYIHTKNNGWSANPDASNQGLVHSSAWALQGVSESTTLLPSPPLKAQDLHNLVPTSFGERKWRDTDNPQRKGIPRKETK